MDKQIILQGIVGSQAYGLATPESDIDQLGVFMTDFKDLVSLTPGPETHVEHEPDLTLHELNKFVKLCCKNNPTVMEFLWLDDYVTMTDEGWWLVESRQEFLSQSVRQTYGGYALAQKERLLRRGDFGSDLKKRTEKHGRHCFRLLLQGIHILRHGEVKVRLEQDQIELCRLAGEMAANNPDAFGRMFDSMDKEFKQTPSSLPEKCDLQIGNEVIWRLRGIE